MFGLCLVSQGLPRMASIPERSNTSKLRRSLCPSHLRYALGMMSELRPCWPLAKVMCLGSVLLQALAPEDCTHCQETKLPLAPESTRNVMGLEFSMLLTSRHLCRPTVTAAHAGVSWVEAPAGDRLLDLVLARPSFWVASPTLIGCKGSCKHSCELLQEASVRREAWAMPFVASWQLKVAPTGVPVAVSAGSLGKAPCKQMLGGLLHGSGNSGPLLPVGLSPEESAWQEELCSLWCR